MIFLTVGTQLPFDRLVALVDEIAAGLNEEVFGQIGAGRYQPQHFAAVAHLTPAAFNTRFSAARMVIGHAGIGTILSAQKYGKPLAVMPRRHELNEHRNNHQLATAAQLGSIVGVHVFDTAEGLRTLLAAPDLPKMTVQAGPNLAGLVLRLRSEIGRAL
jgi:UDP-N-acetylglucosamine transferase subunit ALG13